MSSKIITFILGLAIGAAACAVVLGKKAATEKGQAVAAETQPLNHQIDELKQQAEATKAQLEKAEADNAKLSARVQEAMQRQQSTQAATQKAVKKNPMAAMFGGDGTNNMSEAMNGMMKVAMQQQMEAKLAGMKAKLNLTPDQEKAIRDIMEKQADKGTEMAQKMFKGELTKEEMEKMGTGAASEEDQIKALLTPEQVAAYGDYQTDEKNRMTRLMANSELMQLQSTLQLTDEQQDKVFEVLVNHAQQQFDSTKNSGTGLPASGMDKWREQNQQKAADLQGILTADQFQRYQKFQEQQLKMMEAFMPKN